MQGEDRQVSEAINQALSQGQSGWLCTVMSTYGSSPRPVGSMLFLPFAGSRPGAITGSVSGGCVEQLLLEQLAMPDDHTVPVRVISYGAEAASPQDARVSLPCGGTLRLVLEWLTPARQSEFFALHQQIENGHSVTRTVTLPDKRQFEHTIGPTQQLVLIGRSLVAEQVARLALFTGYRVTVLDPRPGELDDWPVDGCESLCTLADNWFRAGKSYRHCAVLALTHDPRIDDLGMLAALETDAFYVGAMGSARTSEARRERYRQLGVSDTQLERLKAPIGLPIGSKTPAEIAVAVIGDLISHVRQ